MKKKYLIPLMDYSVISINEFISTSGNDQYQNDNCAGDGFGNIGDNNLN